MKLNRKPLFNNIMQFLCPLLHEIVPWVHFYHFINKYNSFLELRLIITCKMIEKNNNFVQKS